jgi:L-arabinokinase
MGGFSEYCGSPTLALPTSEFITCAAQQRDDQRVLVNLVLEGSNGHPNASVMPLAAWYDHDGLVRAEVMRARLEKGAHLWAWPAFAVLHEMLSEGAAPHLGGGLNIALAGAQPWEGDSRASLAAAAATAAAVAPVLGIEGSAVDLARWVDACAGVFLGLPCGYSAAMCALSGRGGSLLQVRSQPQPGSAVVPLPNGIVFAGVDCGALHPQSERKFREARTAAFMGRRIIERLLASRGIGGEWGGYLSRLSVNDYVEFLRDHLPTKMKGRDFVARFGPVENDGCVVEEDAQYKIRSRTEHHIYENMRVHQFADRLSRAQRTGERGALLEAGELMFASHWSYGQRCGLGSIETDRLVNLLRQRGAGAGLFGAKISGCGAGGMVTVLVSDTEAAHDAIRDAAGEYESLTGRKPRVTRGTSDGALVHGVRRIG